MRLDILGFSGMVEVTGPQRLESFQSTDATNCLILAGDLVPFFGPQSSGSGSGKTIFKYNDAWLYWPDVVNCVRSPTSDTPRLYYTGSGYPKVSDAPGTGTPTNHRRVGIPEPNGEQLTLEFNSVEVTLANAVIFIPSAGPATCHITATEPHELEKDDSVILNFPGFPTTAMKVTDIIDTTNFRVDVSYIPHGRFASILLPHHADAQNVWVRASNHGLASGDKVAFYWSGSGDGGTGIVKNQVYQVIYVDTNRFRLAGTAAITATDKQISTRAQQFWCRVSDASNPFEGDSSGTGVDPTVIWGDSGKKRFSFTVYPTDEQNSVTSTTALAEVRSRSYLATYVNGYGAEGPPSNPSKVIDMVPGKPVKVNLPTSGFGLAGAVSAGDVASGSKYYVQKVRLYRTDESGNWRFLTDQPLGTTFFEDKLFDSDLGEVLPSEGWLEPPDSLEGLTSMPGGILLGYSGKTIYASVPYIPSAWPLAHQVNAEYDVRGLVVTGAGIVVLTEGNPSMIIGTDPATWAVVKLEIPQACASVRSVVDMGDYGIYSSPDGLVAIQQNNAKVITSEVFSREQWADYDPDVIIGAFYEDRYFGAYGSKAFIFSPQTGDFIKVDMPHGIDAFYNDLLTDTLYFLSGGTIYAWDRDMANPLSLTWVSKLFQAPKPVNFASAQVDVDGCATFELKADGTTVFTKEVTSGDPFRLPSGYYARDYYITLKGTCKVRKCSVATSVDDLKEV